MRFRSRFRGLPFAGALVVFAGARAIAVSGKSGAPGAPQGSRERVQAIAVSGKSGAPGAPQGSRERVQAIATIAASKTCAACHPAHFEQWSKGAHAKGSGNPVFLAVRARYSGAKEDCDACHEPEGPHAGPDFRGVGCDHCHTTRDVRPGTGIAALVRVPGPVKRGPLTDAKPVGHLAEGDPELFANRPDLCLACHAGAPQLCVTPTDYALSPAARFGGRVCQDCHMSLAESKAAVTAPDVRLVHGHAMLAARDPEMLTRGADLALAVEATNGGFVAVATVANKAAGHSFPSGYPLRMAAVRFQVVDSAGHATWSSFVSEPPEDARFMRFEVDSTGQGPVLPWLARGVGADTRIRPLSARAVRARLPAGATRVEAEVVYWTLPPSVARDLGVEAPPVVTRRASIALE